MGTDATHKTIAFGSIEHISRIISTASEAAHLSQLPLSTDRTQRNGSFYAMFEQRVPERFQFDFWDHIIPQFPNLRFLLSKISEDECYRTQVIRHRHTPFGFNLCLSDHTTPQSMDAFPQDENPIWARKDFYEDVLRDSELRHALHLLGYPHEMLAGCTAAGEA